LESIDVIDWFHGHSLRAPSAYVDFLCQIGSGVFFGGGLTIYPLSSPNSKSVESELLRLRTATKDVLIPFGYDGTTELCYCFDGQSGSDSVSWFSWEEKVVRSLSPSFAIWVESRPAELFAECIYAGYRRVHDIDGLYGVMEDRSAFRVRLLEFERELQRPPDRPEDRLRRYNRLVLEVTKTRNVQIPVLTVQVARVGSQLGSDNVEYATFRVDDLPINAPTLRECYVFDPFNVPFTDIEVNFTPVIDVTSPMRVRFKELSKILSR
jgi:hypothetical protein